MYVYRFCHPTYTCAPRLSISAHASGHSLGRLAAGLGRFRRRGGRARPMPASRRNKETIAQAYLPIRRFCSSALLPLMGLPCTEQLRNAPTTYDGIRTSKVTHGVVLDGQRPPQLGPPRGGQNAKTAHAGFEPAPSGA